MESYRAGGPTEPGEERTPFERSGQAPVTKGKDKVTEKFFVTFAVAFVTFVFALLRSTGRALPQLLDSPRRLPT